MSNIINESLNGKIAKFEFEAKELFYLCDCLSLLRNKIGIIGIDDEDFLTLFKEGLTMFYTVKDKKYYFCS